MPPVAFCDYNNRGTPWEIQMNGTVPLKKAMSSMNTFVNTSDCGNRNNQFQTQVIDNQFKQDSNYVMSGFGLTKSMPQNEPDIEQPEAAVQQQLALSSPENNVSEIDISELYKPYQLKNISSIPNYMGIDQAIPRSYGEKTKESIKSYIDSYMRTYLPQYQENFSNMSMPGIDMQDKELLFLYIILIIFCILFVKELAVLLKVLYKIS